MGTGILATLTQLHVGSSVVGAACATCLLTLGWLLILVLCVGFFYCCLRHRGTFRAATIGVAGSAWGMVSMGILAVGAATPTVVPATSPWSSTAWLVDAVLWVVGATLGLLTTIGFTGQAIASLPQEPRPAWALAVVPPMVAATGGTSFVARTNNPTLATVLLVFIAGFFVTSLVLGATIFATSFHFHHTTSPLPHAAATTAWIPLGVVGQSTAAALRIAATATPFLLPATATALHSLARVYGFAMLTLAVPLVTLATVVTIRGFRNRMPFTPGWWSLTFPLGTLSLGAYWLADATGNHAISVIAVGLWCALVGTWTFCAVSTIRVLAHRWPQMFAHVSAP